MDYYEKFINPCEIKRDINFFYNNIKEIICNNIFSEYIQDSRKKIHKIYELNNFLSHFEGTRLQFNNDKISIEFFVNDSIGENPNLITFKNAGVFKNYKMNDVDMTIKINLSHVEYINKIIYDNNDFFINLRKQISIIHNTFVEEHNTKEESKFKFINMKLIKLKKSHFDFWNKFVLYLLDATDPNFKNTLSEFKTVFDGIRTEKISTNFELMHNTNFYLSNCHLRQIKALKFLSVLKKTCLDDEEIVYLTKEISNCFNHSISNYDESIEFITNVLEHFNFIYHTKEKYMNFFVSRNWNSI